MNALRGPTIEIQELGRSGIKEILVRGHCMCKEMPVIPVNRVVDPKRLLGIKWSAEEEERHKTSLTPPPSKNKSKN
jgi:hypothetical protein